MSSSSSAPAPLATPELRTGTWTRFGSDAVLGDAVTEETLSALAESTRTAARSQGYAVGWAEGQRAARTAAEEEALRVAAERAREDEVRAAEHAAAVAALLAATEQLRAATAQATDHLADQASGLALELTRTIVGVAVGELDAVRRALALAPGTDPVTVRVHPDDAVLDDDTARALADRGAVVHADPSLDRGDALVEGIEHVVDLRLSTALARVREVLA